MDSAPGTARYWSDQFAEAEWDRLWSRCWHMGPRVEELPEPGDAMVHQLGRESLIFLRDDDGAVRGYFNVCPHRGNRLLLGEEGPSFVGAFECAFHGWQFGHDGAVKHIPCRERFDEQTLADGNATSLRAFRVEQWAGWLWFTLDENAPDLSTYLGSMRTELDGYRMERAHIVDYVTIDFRCNWKTVLDAFNESYHFQALHRDILSWGNEDAPIRLLGIHSMMFNEYGRPSGLFSDQQTVTPPLKALLDMVGIDPETFEGTAQDVRTAVQKAKRARQDDSLFPYEVCPTGN